MTPTVFELAVVGWRDGTLSIAFLAPLSAPHGEHKVCVSILECSEETARAMCESVTAAIER